jgi:hypothetical protein
MLLEAAILLEAAAKLDNRAEELLAGDGEGETKTVDDIVTVPAAGDELLDRAYHAC